MELSDERLSILLVESNPDNLHFLKQRLEEDLRYPSQIDTVHTLEEAESRIKKNLYHLLLVESEVDGKAGIDLIETITAEKMKLPFILLTPIRDDKLARDAITRGVADVIITSESQFDQLAETIRNSCNKFFKKSYEAAEGDVIDLTHASEDLIRRLEHETGEKSQLESAPPVIKDELTGLFTHGYMHERIVREFSRAARYGYPLSCLLLDVDHFKKINEKYGHRVGDMILKESAHLIFDSCRLSDLIARYGGTEFLVLLPHISYQGAEQLSKRLRKIFEKHVFLKDSEKISVTVSIGLSSYPEDDMERRSDLITFARKALLDAKSKGINRSSQYQNVMRSESGRIPKLEMSEDNINEFQQRIQEVADDARRDYLQVSRDLLFALESKDKFTAGHGAHCAKYANLVGRKMQLPPDEIDMIENGCMLHDIGKICIPDEILLKTGKLTFNEYEIMKQHTYYGFKVLKPIKFMREEALIVLHHHEWYNGEGYPCHLKGDEIPLGARICAVIDAYDTMRAAGARYKKTMTVEKCVGELIQMSGTQFDPQVVKTFIDVLIDRGELKAGEFDKKRLEEAVEAIYTRRQSSEPTE